MGEGVGGVWIKTCVRHKFVSEERVVREMVNTHMAS